MYARTAYPGQAQAQPTPMRGTAAPSDDAALLGEESMRAWGATYGATGTAVVARPSSRGSVTPRPTARASPAAAAAVDIYAQHNAWYRGGGGAATPSGSGGGGSGGGSHSARPSRPNSSTRTQPRRPLDPATHAATTALSLGLSAATGLALLHSSPAHMGAPFGSHTARPASRQNYQPQYPQQQPQPPHPDRAWLLNQGLLGSLNGRSHTTAAGGDAHTILPRIARADAAATGSSHGTEEAAAAAETGEEQEQEEKTATGPGTAHSRAGSAGFNRPSRHSTHGDGNSPDLALRALLLNQAVLGSGGYFSFTPQPRVAVPAEPLSGAFMPHRREQRASGSRSRPGSSGGLDTRMRPNHAGTPSTRVVPPFKPAFTIAAPPPPPHSSSAGADAAGAQQRSYVNYAQLMMRTHSRASSAATPAPTTPVTRVRTPLSQAQQQRGGRPPSTGAGATARSYRPGSGVGLGLKLGDVVGDDRASSSGSGLVSRSSRASLRDAATGSGIGVGGGTGTGAPGPELFDEESLVGAEVMRLAAAPESELLAQILASQREDEAAALEAHFSGEDHLAHYQQHQAGGRAPFDRAWTFRGGAVPSPVPSATARTASMPAPSAPLTTEESLADQAAQIRELEAQFANLHRQQPGAVTEGRGASARSKSRRFTMKKALPPDTDAAAAAAAAAPIPAAAAPAALSLASRARASPQGGLMSPGQRAHFVAQRRALDETEEKHQQRQRASAASSAAASASAAALTPQAHVRFIDEQESQSRRPALEKLSAEQQRALHQRWAALDAAHMAALSTSGGGGGGGGGGSGDGSAGPDPLSQEVAAVLSRVDSITTVQALWRGRRARAHVQRRRARLRAMEEAERRAAEEQALFDQITAQQQQEQEQQQHPLATSADSDPAASAPPALDPWEEEAEAPDPEVQLALLQAAQKQARLVAQFDSAMAATEAQLDATNIAATLTQQQHPHPPKTGTAAALARRQSRGRRVRQIQAAASSLPGSAGPSSSCATPIPVPGADPALSHAAQLRLQLKQSLQAEAAMIRDMLLENAAKARIHAQHSAAQRAHRSALAHRALLSTMSMGSGGGGGGGGASGSGPPGSGGAPRVPGGGGGGGGGGASGARRRDLYGSASPSLDENGSDMGGEDPTDELLYGQLSGLGVGSAAGGATQARDSFGFDLASNNGSSDGEDRHRGGGRGHYHSASMSSVSEEPNSGGGGSGAGEGGLFGPGLALVGLGGETHAYRTQLRNAGLLIEGAGSGADAAPGTGTAAPAAPGPKHSGMGAAAGGVSAGLADQIARWVTGFTGDVFGTRKTPAPRHWRGGGGPDGNGGGGSFHDELLYDRDSDDMRFVSGASDLAGEPPLAPLVRSASDVACEALERRNDLLVSAALREAKQSTEEEERARVATCAAEVERALLREDALIRVQSLARGRSARKYAAQLRAERPPQPQPAVPPPLTAKQAAAAAAEAAHAALLEEHRAAEEVRMAGVAAARAEQRRKEEEELARAQEEDAGLARILAAEAEAAAAAKAEEEKAAAEAARAQAEVEEAEAAAQAQSLREAQAAAQRESDRIAAVLSSSRNPFALDLSAAAQLADLAPGLFALNPVSPRSALRERLAEGQCDRCRDRRASVWCGVCALKLCDDLTGAGCDGDVHLRADMGAHKRVAWPVQEQAAWGEAGAAPAAVEADGDESADFSAVHKSHSFSYAEGLTGSTGGPSALHQHSFSHPSCAPTPPPPPAPACAFAVASAAAVAASATKCDECRKWQASVWCAGCSKKLCDDLTGNDCDGTIHLRSEHRHHRRVRWDPIKSPARSRPNTAAALAAGTTVPPATPDQQTTGPAVTQPPSGSTNGLVHVPGHATVSSDVSSPAQEKQRLPRAPSSDANVSTSPASAPAAPASTAPPSAPLASVPLAPLCDYCESGTRISHCAQCSMALCDTCDTELHAVRNNAAHVRVPVQIQLLGQPQPSEQLAPPPPAAAASAPAPALCAWCDSAVPSLYCASCSLSLCVACEGEVHAAREKRSHQCRPLHQASDDDRTAVETVASVAAAAPEADAETVSAPSSHQPPVVTEDSTNANATTKPSDEPAHASGLTAAERAVLDARAAIYSALTSAPVDALFPSHSCSGVSPVLSGRDLSDIVLAGGSAAEALRLLRSMAAMDPVPVLHSFSQLPDAIWAAWNAEHDATRAARKAQPEAARDGADDGALTPPSPSIARVRPPPSQLPLDFNEASGVHQAQRESPHADSESGCEGLLVAAPPSRLKVMLPPSPALTDGEMLAVRHSEEALIAAEWAAYERSQSEQAEQKRAAQQQAQRAARAAAEQERRKREMYVLYGDDAPPLLAQQDSTDAAPAVSSATHSRATSTAPAPTVAAAASASDQPQSQPRSSYQQSLLSPVRRTGAAQPSSSEPASGSPSSSPASSSFPRGVATELDGGSWQLSYPILLAAPHLSPSPSLIRSGSLHFDPLVDLVAFRRRTFTRREALDVIAVQSAWRRRQAARRVRRMRTGQGE